MMSKAITIILFLTALAIPQLSQQSPPSKSAQQTAQPETVVPPIEEQQVVLNLLRQRELIDAQIEGALQMMMQSHKLPRDQWRPTYDKSRVWFIKIPVKDEPEKQ